MPRFWLTFALLAAAQPAWAGDIDAPYYDPMKCWHGIGYRFSYEDRVEKDGAWRIDAAVHAHCDAIDIALYRAAELARAQGYRYLHLLGGNESRSPGIDAATLHARPGHDGGPPVGCRSKKVTACYTADVAEIMRVLGGPGGTRPGVPIVDHCDRFGREVFLSGYGTGAVEGSRSRRSSRSALRSHVRHRPLRRAEPRGRAPLRSPALRRRSSHSPTTRPPPRAAASTGRYARTCRSAVDPSRDGRSATERRPSPRPDPGARF